MTIRSKTSSKTTDFSYFGGAESLLEGKQRSPRRTEVPKPTDKDDGQSYPALPQDPSDFLWLMTEEPHRTRRMEIMKAHPEVFFVRLDQCGTIDMGWFSGHEAHGPRAADKICRFGGRSAPTWSSNLSPTYPTFISNVYILSLYHRRHSEPQSLFGYP